MDWKEFCEKVKKLYKASYVHTEGYGKRLSINKGGKDSIEVEWEDSDEAYSIGIHREHYEGEFYIGIECGITDLKQIYNVIKEISKLKSIFDE